MAEFLLFLMLIIIVCLVISTGYHLTTQKMHWTTESTRFWYICIVAFLILVPWRCSALFQDYEIADIKICPAIVDGERRFIQFIGVDNKYRKEEVGNAEYYRVIEYKQWYSGIKHSRWPSIGPVVERDFDRSCIYKFPNEIKQENKQEKRQYTTAGAY